LDGAKSFLAEFRKIFKAHSHNAGGVYILHCERKKHSDGSECERGDCHRKHYWVWGPHVHFVGWGYFDNSAQVHSKTGWVYKTISDGEKSRNIYETVRYQLSHAGLFKNNGMVVRYIAQGTLGKKTIVSRSREPVLCPVCQSALRRRAVYPDGTIDLASDIGPYTESRMICKWLLTAKQLSRLLGDGLVGGSSLRG
jgi:hypothetical protein